MFEVIVLKLFILLGWFVRGVMEENWHYFYGERFTHKRNECITWFLTLHKLTFRA